MTQKVELPSAEDLWQLSLHAMVAYAARCARRVQPLFISGVPEHIEAVDRAILMAEHFASGDEHDTQAATDAANNAAAAAAEAARDGTLDSARAAASARAAVHVICAPDIADAARDAADAANAARVAGAAAVLASQVDFQRLVTLTTKPAPALGDPIDIDELGPLWPEAESLEKLGLSTTVDKLLLEADIFSIKTLIQKSRDELLGLGGIGPKRLAEIESALEQHGLKLAE